MVNVPDKITNINSLLVNHEMTYRHCAGCQNAVTDMLNYVKTRLVTSPETQIYNNVLKIFENDYEDNIIQKNFSDVTNPEPLLDNERYQSYICEEHLYKLLSNIEREARVYARDFIPPTNSTAQNQSTQNQSTQNQTVNNTQILSNNLIFSRN